MSEPTQEPPQPSVEEKTSEKTRKLRKAAPAPTEDDLDAIERLEGEGGITNGH